MKRVNEDEMKKDIRTALINFVNNEDKIEKTFSNILSFKEKEIIKNFSDMGDSTCILISNIMDCLLYSAMLDSIGVDVFTYIAKRIIIDHDKDIEKIIKEAMFDNYDFSGAEDYWNEP